MKKVIKSRIFLVIITMIICISGTLYAATEYYASDVVYNASDGTSMTVNDALNELYNKCGEVNEKPDGSSTTKVYENGTAIYYNPVTGTTCDSSEAVSTTGTKTGCMKWYTFNDSSESSTVDVILDHNTTALLAWYSQTKNVAYVSSKIKPT